MEGLLNQRAGAVSMKTFKQFSYHSLQSSSALIRLCTLVALISFLMYFGSLNFLHMYFGSLICFLMYFGSLICLLMYFDSFNCKQYEP